MKKAAKLFGILSIVLVVGLFLYQPVVNSRAGGGEDYGTGGFDIDFGDTGSSGSSSSTFVPIGTGGGGGGSVAGVFCCIGLILVFIIFMAIAKKKGWVKPSAKRPTRSFTPMERMRYEHGEVQQGLGQKKKALKKSDPNWNEQRFLDTAETIFHTVQEAWTKNELGIARPFLSDSVYTRFKKQLADLSKRGLKNVLENVVVGSTEIVKIEQDDDYDTISVKIKASMIDYKVEEKTGKVVSGSKTQSPPFAEYWVFLRKAGTKTRDVPTIKEKKCPNCGAPLEINESGKCSYCKANVVSGDFDWVLSKITQREEWKV